MYVNPHRYHVLSEKSAAEGHAHRKERKAVIPPFGLTPRAPSSREWLAIALVPVGIIVLNVISAFVVRIPDQPGILILPVVCSALLGGVWIGVLASAIHLAYGFWFQSGVEMSPVLLLVSPGVAIAAGLSTTSLSGLQRTVAEHEKMAALMFERSSIGIAYVGVNGFIRRCNSAFAKLVGRPAGEVEGMKFSDLIDQRDRDANVSLARQLFSGFLTEYTLENRYSRKTGGFTWVQKVVSLIRDGNGRPQTLLVFARDVSEEKRLEDQHREAVDALRRSADELMKSQELLSLAEQSAKAGSWTWNVGTTSLDWSPEMFRLFGVDPDEAVPTLDTWRKCLHPLDLAITEKILDASIAEHRPFATSYRVVHRNGDVAWISAIGRMTYDAQDKPLRMSGICIDITEQKRVEDAHQELETHYSAFFENVSVGAAQIDRSGRFLNVNSRFSELCGYTPEQLLAGMTPQDLCYPDEVSKVRDGIARVLTGESDVYNDEHRMKRPDGRECYVNASASPIRDRYGNVTRLAGLVTDITQRHSAEMGLRESEASLRAFFDNAAIGAVQLDADARFVRVNAAYCTIVGYASDELIGRMTPFDFDAPEYRDADQAGIRSLLDGAETQYVVEKQIVRKDGMRRWVRTATSVVRREGSKIVRTAALVTDITARKEAEVRLVESRDQLQALNQSLEAQVQSRTASLIAANRRLEQLARMDALTGIPNRLAANEKLRQEFMFMKRMTQPYSVLMMDIDHFKAVNDTHGHEVGDRVLQEVAQRLHKELRESDFIARFGGEEFLAVLPATPLEGAVVVAEKLRRAIEALEMPGVERVTISIGVAAASCESATEDEAVNDADGRLYEAKTGGRNRVVSDPAVRAAGSPP